MPDLIREMKALSDETRLRIIMILLKRDCCVCEVMQALDISQSRASRNLSILQEAGFLTAKRDGSWTVYSVNWQAADNSAIALLRLLQESPIDGEVLEKDRRRLSQSRRVGPGCLPAGKRGGH
jgi:ArsR family transcriptional regulator